MAKHNEEFIQDMEKFLSSTCYEYLRNEYNKRVLKKMENLHYHALTKDENLIRIDAGDISGFKSGFELIETVVAEHRREEEKP